jgi:hypothetical protein
MNKIAVAVSAAMGASMAAGVANADSIFFPYVVKSPTVATILSVINTAEDINLEANDASTHTHVRYVYKLEANATVNTASCQNVDFTFSSSQNDIVSFDVGGHFGNSQGVLFNDETTYNLDFARLRTATYARAFVLVDNNNFGTGTDVGNDEGTMFGEALVMEYVGGAAWGYRALNADQATTETNGSQGLNFRPANFGSTGGLRVPVLGYNEDADVNGMARATLLPWSEFDTVFFVTPTSAQAAATNPGFTPNGQYTPNLNARIRPNLEAFVPYDAEAAIVDRNENPISGRVPQNVVCVGAVNLKSMLSDLVVAAPEWSAQGGWTNVEVYTGSINAGVVNVSHAAVIKLEYNEGETFDGTSTGGIFNNGFLMNVDQTD